MLLYSKCVKNHCKLLGIYAQWYIFQTLSKCQVACRTHCYLSQCKKPYNSVKNWGTYRLCRVQSCIILSFSVTNKLAFSVVKAHSRLHCAILYNKYETIVFTTFYSFLSINISFVWSQFVVKYPQKAQRTRECLFSVQFTHFQQKWSE